MLAFDFDISIRQVVYSMSRFFRLTLFQHQQNLSKLSRFKRNKWSQPQQLRVEEIVNQPAEYLKVQVGVDKVLWLSVNWLRDSCLCSSCKHPESGFRLNHQYHDPTLKQSRIEDGVLHLTWGDGHVTSLLVNTLSEQNGGREPEKTLWDKETASTIPFTRLNFKDLLSSEQAVFLFLSSVFKYGIATVDDVPATSDDTKRVMERFGPIWRTFWGEVYHVVADLGQFAHPSYTGNAVQLHTDTNYYHEGAGLQAFHVLHHDGDGAINCFVDGFRVAKTIKQQQPEIYDFLSKTPIPFKYDEKVKKLHLVNEDTIFKHHPFSKNIVQIRYTPYDLDTYRCHPQQNMNQFYSGLKVLKDEISCDENRHWIHLKPGTVLVTDNWRILHGRSEFTGSRTLCGMYVSRSDYLSRLRSLGIISI